jgi:NitT/TauT family transport system substrate-binding protein
MSPTKWTRVGAIVVAAMLAAACGSSAEPASGPDSDLLTPDGRLKTPTDVTINVASRAVLDFSSPLLAQELGVFEKYGINLKVESVPTNEAVPLLATGKIDVLIGGLNAGVFNAITGGYNIKVVAPANYQAPDSNIGIWASTKWLNGREISAEVLRGSTHASSQGYQGITMVSYVQLLRKYGLDVNDVNIETMPQTDQVVALETGAIATGTPSPAGTAALAETGAAVFVAPQIPQGWPVVVFMFGPNLLNDRPEVGYAFVAAMRDLYKNYLQPGYKDNPGLGT